MKDRLQKFLVNEKLSPTRFAEIIGVQRSSISHILSGRNKPSFDVIQSILEKFPKLNPDWLIVGNGEIYRKPIQTSIFDYTEHQKKEIEKDEDEYLNIKVPYNEKIDDVILSKKEIHQSKVTENAINEKKIERVVVFYKDKTFTEYRPEK
jgi:transcriptional regulator with XRE-family HTH domain